MPRFTQIALAAAVAATLGTAAPTAAEAAGYYVNKSATTVNFPAWDRLNIRKWPAAHSRLVGKVKRYRSVYVERCILKSGTDWCKIHGGGSYGWVNGRFLVRNGSTFASPHPEAHGWH